MDLITDLPKLNNFDCILAIVDHGLTKGIILVPTQKTANSKEIAQLLLENLFKRYGLPDKVISDQDLRFALKVMCALYKLLDIETAYSAAYHLQTDRSMEHFNQEIKTYLTIACANNLHQWSIYLYIYKFTHNNQLHTGCSETPFELMYGSKPKALPSEIETSESPDAQECLEKLNDSQSKAIIKCIKLWQVGHLIIDFPSTVKETKFG